jgi:hypothetical protein
MCSAGEWRARQHAHLALADIQVEVRDLDLISIHTISYLCTWGCTRRNELKLAPFASAWALGKIEQAYLFMAPGDKGEASPAENVCDSACVFDGVCVSGCV